MKLKDWVKIDSSLLKAILQSFFPHCYVRTSKLTVMIVFFIVITLSILTSLNSIKASNYVVNKTLR